MTEFGTPVDFKFRKTIIGKLIWYYPIDNSIFLSRSVGYIILSWFRQVLRFHKSPENVTTLCIPGWNMITLNDIRHLRHKAFANHSRSINFCSQTCLVLLRSLTAVNGPRLTSWSSICIFETLYLCSLVLIDMYSNKLIWNLNFELMPFTLIAFRSKSRVMRCIIWHNRYLYILVCNIFILKHHCECNRCSVGRAGSSGKHLSHPNWSSNDNAGDLRLKTRICYDTT